MSITAVGIPVDKTGSVERARPVWSSSFLRVLFPESLELLPQVSQRYEFELAYAESKTLSEDELLKRSAYFREVNGRPTNHYVICQRRPVQVDPDLKHRQSFFDANAYGVGYATHGLFPYRGKFHPQMVKGLMNAIGLRPGDTVLDPMCGSGTTLIEASIIGVNSVGVELSPFACLMSRGKLAGLEMDCSGFARLLEIPDRIFAHFSRRKGPLDSLFEYSPSSEGPVVLEELEGSEARRELVLLAYLDSLGYATRRKNRTAAELFPTVLRRYFAAVQEFNAAREELSLQLGKAKVMCGDARRLAIPDRLIDGVIFSPPYSFAIDYVANDDQQLRYLGFDPKELSDQMVGLSGGEGRTKDQRIAGRVRRYFADMDLVIGECARVMKPGACCVIVIGSNTNQTGGVRLEGTMMDFAGKHGMPLHWHITREIEGIRNTMRDEHLLIFRKA
jgi:hypothetical protein